MMVQERQLDHWANMFVFHSTLVITQKALLSINLVLRGFQVQESVGGKVKFTYNNPWLVAL